MQHNWNINPFERIKTDLYWNNTDECDKFN